jgi:hypothetical protein
VDGKSHLCETETVVLYSEHQDLLEQHRVWLDPMLTESFQQTVAGQLNNNNKISTFNREPSFLSLSCPALPCGQMLVA